MCVFVRGVCIINTIFTGFSVGALLVGVNICSLGSILIVDCSF